MTRKGTVTVERDGKRYDGEWRLTANDMITVGLAGYGLKSTQLGGHSSAPQVLATKLLRELVTEMANGHLPMRPHATYNAFSGKTCKCHGSDYRDPDCERLHPEICPWREFDLMLLAGPLPKKSGN